MGSHVYLKLLWHDCEYIMEYGVSVVLKIIGVWIFIERCKIWMINTILPDGDPNVSNQRMVFHHVSSWQDLGASDQCRETMD